MHILIAGLFVMFAGVAQAQTASQREYLRYLAYAVALNDKCPAWRTNPFTATAYGKERGVAVDDWTGGGRWNGVLMEEMKSAHAIIGVNSPQSACDLSQRWFGRNGQRMPGLMTRD